MTTHSTLKSFLTVEEVAELLNVAEKTVRKYVWERSIPYYKIGGHVLFNEQKLLDWIAEKEMPAYNQRGRKRRK
jgi:excisionase family DNA binding protein